MKLLNLSPGESVTGTFVGWSDWHFKPDAPEEVTWLPTLVDIKTGEYVVLSQNFDLLSKLEAGAKAGKIKEEETEITVKCVGEEELDGGRRMKLYDVLVGKDRIESRRIVSSAEVFGFGKSEL